MLNIDDFNTAANAINGFVAKTPFAFAPRLSRMMEAQIYLKKENLQITGAYKVRGAFNKIASLDEAAKKSGVIAASAGNHAQGVAIAAAHFGVRALIIMPEAAPLSKVAGTKALGAEVILKGDNFDEAYAYAVKYASEHSLTFVHPFDDPKVQAGQGTIALEMLNEVSDLDFIVVPVGGGGLISGVAACAKIINPNIKIIGVGAAGAPAMFNSFIAKTPINSASVRTIADGIAVRDTSPATLANILKSVDMMVQVSDEEIAGAILYLLEQQKIVVEGAGGASVAAIMNRKFGFDKNAKIGAIISGGNIDVQVLNTIIEKGLIASARKMILHVTLIDKPGALMGLTDIISAAGANIVKIDYDRFSTKLSYGDAMITITLETKGKEHQEKVREALNKAGYIFEQEF